MQSGDDRQTLTAIFWRFLRFGLLALGGPVAQIAMIKRELVEEERWIDCRGSTVCSRSTKCSPALKRTSYASTSA